MYVCVGKIYNIHSHIHTYTQTYTHACIHTMLQVYGEISDHVEGKRALVQGLVDTDFKSLGGPPRYACMHMSSCVDVVYVSGMCACVYLLILKKKHTCNTHKTVFIRVIIIIYLFIFSTCIHGIKSLW
jgi:hypothetical protein